jgi:hypothetical protein
MSAGPTLPGPRRGTRIEITGHQTEFSFWPTRGAQGAREVQSRLFALDPWAIIRQVVETTSLPNDTREEALATLRQAEDFYEIGTGRGNEAARPLVLYYSYLNLAKTFCLTRGPRTTLDLAGHGLVAPRAPTSSTAPLDVPLEVEKSGPRGARQQYHISAFDEFRQALTGTGTPSNASLKVASLLPQILSGHRLWAQGARQQERFVIVETIRFLHDGSGSMWLELRLKRQDLARLGTTTQAMLAASGLGAAFQEVRDEPGWVRLEQTSPLPYPAGGEVEHLHELVAAVRANLWMTVSILPPYRRYYVYLCPPAEQAQLLPQLLSMYAMTFYFGSITRYRPHRFDLLLKGAFGPRVRDFVTGQPQQFLYQMASEFAERDVARPSIL